MTLLPLPPLLQMTFLSYRGLRPRGQPRPIGTLGLACCMTGSPFEDMQSEPKVPMKRQICSHRK